jgi:transposase
MFACQGCVPPSHLKAQPAATGGEHVDSLVSRKYQCWGEMPIIDFTHLKQLGFARADPASTGRPAYHPAVLLKIYNYRHLNRVQSSRRLEREAQRNVELIWLTGRLMPDFKTIADFRKDNGDAIRTAWREFALLCRGLGLFEEATVAIDGSKLARGPLVRGARSIYAAAGIAAGLARERARARRSEAPSPRQALPCMQARTWGCSRARRSRVAPVCGACA